MSRLALHIAIALLPPSRRAWGEAMKAEYAHMEEGQNVFAWGCLKSSLTENVATGEGWARLFLMGLLLVASSWLGLGYGLGRQSSVRKTLLDLRILRRCFGGLS
jgi:hypothetical protein